MTAAAKFVELPPGRRTLLLRACFVVAGFRLALTTLPFRWVRSLAEFSGRTRRSRLRPPVPVDEFSWAVSVASRRVPRATCLTQALALQLLLAHEGRPSNLRIGVAKAEDGRLQAHAWLETEGRVVIGGGEVERFTPLASLGARAL